MDAYANERTHARTTKRVTFCDVIQIGGKTVFHRLFQLGTARLGQLHLSDVVEP